MREAQRAAEMEEDPTGAAALTVQTSTDSTSVSARLPGKYASDLLPMSAIVACAAGPPAIFYTADVTSMPWWAAGTVGLVQLVAVTLIVILRRVRRGA